MRWKTENMMWNVKKRKKGVEYGEGVETIVDSLMVKNAKFIFIINF